MGLRDERWEKNLKIVKQFAKREGHSCVPARHIEKGIRIGRWVNQQRQRRETMSAERRGKLESLPFWSWVERDSRWEEWYEMLKEYQSEHGTCLVPRTVKVNGWSLGAWVWHQRSDYRANKLSAERISKLEKLRGWVWEFSRYNRP